MAFACILFMSLYGHLSMKLNLEEALGKSRRNSNGSLKTLREIYTKPNLKQCSRVSSPWRKSYSYSHRYPLQGFCWNNHPSLVSEAIEHGWITFGFIKTCTPSFPSNLWGLYNRFSYRGGVEPEISWEMGSRVTCLQKIRLNPGINTVKNINLLLPVQSVQAALPLPGPQSFPQVAYFEITILAEDGEQAGNLFCSKNFGDDFEVKLLKQFSNSEIHLQHMSSEMRSTTLSPNCKEDVEVQNPRNSLKSNHFQFNSMEHVGIPKVISVGLAVGGTALYRLPGCEQGSVGFHSTGFVFLNGMVHLDGDQKQDKPASANRAWGGVNTVIGCGFDPANRKVFYTLNSEQIYSLTCNSDEFNNPLYPTIAANYDVTVLVNLGQIPFKFLAANEQRVADPCFRRLLPSNRVNHLSSTSFCEDSSDLFSMRIDENIRCFTSHLQDNHHLSFQNDSDLFEISLD
ncbi:hypothetical protein SUGI_0899580 [Cryptomeria japonica]|nr:hypothetical protein SUGI_0899580 [Cryptomeria japonica]